MLVPHPFLEPNARPRSPRSPCFTHPEGGTESRSLSLARLARNEGSRPPLARLVLIVAMSPDATNSWPCTLVLYAVAMIGINCAACTVMFEPLIGFDPDILCSKQFGLAWPSHQYEFTTATLPNKATAYHCSIQGSWSAHEPLFFYCDWSSPQQQQRQTPPSYNPYYT